jgi:hypothetical protein
MRLSLSSLAPWSGRALALALGCCAVSGALAFKPAVLTEEDLHWFVGPVDYGLGPGLGLPTTGQLKLGADGVWVQAKARAGTVPVGPPDAQVQGMFGSVFTWPLIPLHMVLVPDGRVLTYGSQLNGMQGAQFNYVIWDPSAGTDPDSMMVMPNSTGTDIFCAAQVLLPDSGSVLILGGDRIVNGQRNYANNDVNIFDPSTNDLNKQAASMAYQRWYATAVTMDTGTQVVLGGRMDRYFAGDANDPPTTATYATSPEVYDAGTWGTLSGADSSTVFGAASSNWSYPQGWLAPNGQVFMLAHSGKMYNLSTAGTGVLTQLTPTTSAAVPALSSTMYAPGKILSLRNGAAAVTVDINGATPKVSATDGPGWNRLYGNTTLLADGTVWASGGSTTGNDLAGEVLQSEIWNPATGHWTLTATAAKPRLYHSAALLMPDATVLTGGGGAPGPVSNLNAEIYYPPYLYLKDGSGNPAPRPTITSAPTVVSWGQQISVNVKSATPVSRLSFVRMGTVTHDFNNDQRFTELKFKVKGKQLKLTTPTSKTLNPPGFYLLFAFDGNGVPSVARVVKMAD